MVKMLLGNEQGSCRVLTPACSEVTSVPFILVTYRTRRQRAKQRRNLNTLGFPPACYGLELQFLTFVLQTDVHTALTTHPSPSRRDDVTA